MSFIKAVDAAMLKLGYSTEDYSMDNSGETSILTLHKETGTQGYADLAKNLNKIGQFNVRPYQGGKGIEFLTTTPKPESAEEKEQMDKININEEMANGVLNIMDGDDESQLVKRHPQYSKTLLTESRPSNGEIRKRHLSINAEGEFVDPQGKVWTWDGNTFVEKENKPVTEAEETPPDGSLESQVKMKFKTLDEMLRSEEYESFISSKLNDLFINEPERAERIADASENGDEGSTHQEVIDDWRDFLSTLKVFDPEYDDEEDAPRYDITTTTENNIEKEIDKTEDWHLKNHSLDKQVG